MAYKKEYFAFHFAYNCHINFHFYSSHFNTYHFSPLNSSLFEPLVKLTEAKFKWKRQVAVMSVFMFILALLATIIYYTITSLVGRIIHFSKMAPEYLNKLSGFWIDFQNKLLVYTSGLPDEVVKSAQGGFNEILESSRKALLELFNSDKIVAHASEIPNFLVSLLVYMVALFLFMLELPELKKMVFRHFTDETAKKVRYMTVKLNSVIFGFLKAQLLVSFIILGVSFVGLLIIAPKYAVVMSIIIWIIDIIPIFRIHRHSGSLVFVPIRQRRHRNGNQVGSFGYRPTRCQKSS